jgi:cyclase
LYRARIIPVLLLKGKALVKTTTFSKPHYIGDPINAVRLFNEMKADELIFLDTEASKKGECIDIELVKEIGEEADMPFGVGGGIRNAEQVKNILAAGAEKVILCSEALANPDFVKEASAQFGSSTICVCLDIKTGFFGGKALYAHSGSKKYAVDPLLYAQEMEKMGAGEVIIQSIDRDGTRKGYDIETLHRIATNLSIPVVGLGGASNLLDLKSLYNKVPLNGLAAGSMFVYQGKQKGVLINYPERKDILELFSTSTEST